MAQHASFSQPFRFCQSRTVLQSDDIKRDAIIEQLERSPKFDETWDILNIDSIHFRATSMATRWIEESKLSPNYGQHAQWSSLHLPKCIPQTHADLHTITEHEAALVGQIPTEALNCNTQLPRGRLYSTGIYDIEDLQNVWIHDSIIGQPHRCPCPKIVWKSHDWWMKRGWGISTKLLPIRHWPFWGPSLHSDF